MNAKLKLLIPVLLILQLPAFAQDAKKIEDQTAAFVEYFSPYYLSPVSHYGTYVVTEDKRKLFLINSVNPPLADGFDGFKVFEADKATNKLQNIQTTSTKDERTRKTRIYGSGYITFDPSGKFLYVVSSNRNFVTQWTLDAANKRFAPDEKKYGPQSDPTFDFQTPCTDRHYDQFRTLQFTKNNRAYLTCKDKDNFLYLVGFDFDKENGTLITNSANNPEEKDAKFPVEERNSATIGKKMGSVGNPLAILFDPSGKYFYAIDGADHKLRQYSFTVGGLA